MTVFLVPPFLLSIAGRIFLTTFPLVEMPLELSFIPGAMLTRRCSLAYFIPVWFWPTGGLRCVRHRGPWSPRNGSHARLCSAAIPSSGELDAAPNLWKAHQHHLRWFETHDSLTFP
jgi:hypothetical protein